MIPRKPGEVETLGTSREELRARQERALERIEASVERKLVQVEIEGPAEVAVVKLPKRPAPVEGVVIRPGAVDDLEKEDREEEEIEEVPEVSGGRASRAGMVSLIVYLPPELRQQYKVTCALLGTTMSADVRVFMEKRVRMAQGELDRVLLGS